MQTAIAKKKPKTQSCQITLGIDVTDKMSSARGYLNVVGVIGFRIAIEWADIQVLCSIIPRAMMAALGNEVVELPEKLLSRELEYEAWNCYRFLLPSLIQSFGPLDQGLIVQGFLQSTDGPKMKVQGTIVTLIVGPNVSVYRPTLWSNIAHEMVHSLNPIKGFASWLEEGAAVNFELKAICRKYGQSERDHFWKHLPESYQDALSDYEKLLEFDFNPGLTIRKVATLSTVSATQLKKVYPKIAESLVKRMVGKQQMR